MPEPDRLLLIRVRACATCPHGRRQGAVLAPDRYWCDLLGRDLELAGRPLHPDCPLPSTEPPNRRPPRR